MISKTLKISLFISVLCSTTFAGAQERTGQKKGNPEEIFKKLDADANASISLEEFSSKKEELMQQRFQHMDSDSNGAIDFSEYRAFVEQDKERRRPRRPRRHQKED